MGNRCPALGSSIRKACCKKLARTDSELIQKGADSTAQELETKGTHLPFGEAYGEETAVSYSLRTSCTAPDSQRSPLFLPAYPARDISQGFQCSSPPATFPVQIPALPQRAPSLAHPKTRRMDWRGSPSSRPATWGRRCQMNQQSEHKTARNYFHKRIQRKGTQQSLDTREL